MTRKSSEPPNDGSELENGSQDGAQFQTARRKPTKRNTRKSTSKISAAAPAAKKQRTESMTKDASTDLPKWEAMPSLEALNLLSNPIMVSDQDNIIRFVNKAATKMFQGLESALREGLPHFDANDVVGKPIDVFHANPAYQHGLIRNMKAPHEGKFTVGGKSLGFMATPVFDSGSNLEFIIVEWQDRTFAVEGQRQIDMLLEDIQNMADDHNRGEIDTYMEAGKFQPHLQSLVGAVNSMVESHIETQRKALDVVEAMAEGNFDMPLEQLPGKKAFVNRTIEGARNAFRSVVDEIVTLSNAIENGKLDVDIDYSKFDGEYQKVVNAFGSAFNSLNSAFNVINDQIDQVKQTVEQMSEASRAMATNSQIASSSVDEVSASAEETDAQVKANAEAASNANTLVSAASEVAVNGKETITDMVNAMEGISSSSQDIAKIIKVIDEIAFQTNLLALNAAVEAARAGQHGRGFAVVAQEVRNLAGRSAKAARETSDLIEDSAARVNSGVKIANQTSESFERIAGDIQQVKGLVEEINVASEEQARGVAQINVAIGEVARTSLATSQQADKLASTASMLTSATDQMANEVRRYKLRAAASEDIAAPIAAMNGLPPELMAQIQSFMANGTATSNGHSNGHSNGTENGDRDVRGFGSF